MADIKQNIVMRFGIVYVVICVSFVAVIWKIFVLQNVEGKKWIALSKKNTKSDIIVKPSRGNIYDCNGRLMASSIPSYMVYMDLRVPALHENDGELFKSKIDSLSEALSEFSNGEKSTSEYKNMLTSAYRTKKAEVKLFKGRISYARLKDLKKLPLLRLGKNKSGLITKEYFLRVKPFGSLASRTIGDIYADESKGGRSGLELYFNDQLIGIPGISIRQKVANKYMEIVKKEPVDGVDVKTTIDVDLQDIAEKALVDSLKSFQAASGSLVLMEVQTGEVKAIVNMQRNSDGSYSEGRNNAVSDLVEPGSTFKIASLMVALDDDKVKLTDSIQTGNGEYRFGSAVMSDHNKNRGGFGKITVAEAIYGSSNIGVSRVIHNAYSKNPEAFVDKLYDMKLNQKLEIEIPGVAAPRIGHPSDKKNWSPTKLEWMSVGYETQIPPIYTLTFFNAIANNGKMIRPIFVKDISHNGVLVKKFQTEVLKDQICKPTTLELIKQVLLGVVEDKKGTAKNIRSKYMRIAGKTGTAQVSKGTVGYTEGGTKHRASFCGYFPADNPRYSCIVVVREPERGHAGGGTMAAPIFKNLAEKTMALKSEMRKVTFEFDSTRTVPLKPYTKAGFGKALELVMNTLKLSFSGKISEWVMTEPNDTMLSISTSNITTQKMSDLKGMGAKDAVFILERMGLKVDVQGSGKVVSQSVQPGVKCRPGTKVVINLN